MDAQKTGTLIAQCRKERNMTQAQLAARLHVTDKAISKWERGAGLPDIHLLEPLSQALGVSLVELVQGQRSAGEALAMADAEQLVADTIRFSSRGTAAKAVGVTALGLIGAACAFLLGLLLTEGSIVLYSVGSLVAGLLAWAAPVWQMTLSRSGRTALAGGISLAAALVALTVQFYQLAHEVDTRDFAAIEDTIHALCLVAVFFSCVTLGLNLLMHRRAGRSRA